jgi:hypothetical protein
VGAPGQEPGVASVEDGFDATEAARVSVAILFAKVGCGEMDWTIAVNVISFDGTLTLGLGRILFTNKITAIAMKVIPAIYKGAAGIFFVFRVCPQYGQCRADSGTGFPHSGLGQCFI